jgi:hypothetical protein
MSVLFISGASAHIPNADVIFDKFRLETAKHLILFATIGITDFDRDGSSLGGNSVYLFAVYIIIQRQAVR